MEAYDSLFRVLGFDSLLHLAGFDSLFHVLGLDSLLQLVDGFDGPQRLDPIAHFGSALQSDSLRLVEFNQDGVKMILVTRFSEFFSFASASASPSESASV